MDLGVSLAQFSENQGDVSKVMTSASEGERAFDNTIHYYYNNVENVRKACTHKICY